MKDLFTNLSWKINWNFLLLYRYRFYIQFFVHCGGNVIIIFIMDLTYWNTQKVINLKLYQNLKIKYITFWNWKVINKIKPIFIFTTIQSIKLVHTNNLKEENRNSRTISQLFGLQCHHLLGSRWIDMCINETLSLSRIYLFIKYKIPFDLIWWYGDVVMCLLMIVLWYMYIYI